MRNWVISIIVLSLAGPLTAAEKDKDWRAELEATIGEPERCLSIIRIDRTEILDDQNILFRMKNGDVYLNQLPYRCPGLSRYDTFMYRTSLSQLCNVDIITVLDSIGFGFRPGPSCGLGMFYPVKDPRAKKSGENDESGESEER